MAEKLIKLEKIADHDHSIKCNTTQEFNRLTADNFVSRLKQANLETKMMLLILSKRYIFIKA